MDATSCRNADDKMLWAFQVYDMDGDGFITLYELINIIEIMDQVTSTPCMVNGEVIANGETKDDPYKKYQSLYGSGENAYEVDSILSAEDRAKQLYQLMDTNE